MRGSSGRTRPLETRQTNSPSGKRPLKRPKPLCDRAVGVREQDLIRLHDEVVSAEDAARQKTAELAEREAAVQSREKTTKKKKKAAGRREKACDERDAALLRREQEVAAREDAVDEMMNLAASLRRREREVEVREKAVGVREKAVGPVAETREAADRGQRNGSTSGSSLEGEKYLATMICTCYCS
jgi:uncharacterized protein (DUF3084 family)